MRHPLHWILASLLVLSLFPWLTAAQLPQTSPTSSPTIRPSATPSPTSPPNGDRLAIYPGNAGQVKLLARFGGYLVGDVYDLQLSPDGKQLVVLGSAGLGLYDSGSLERLWVISGPPRIRAMTFLPGGKLLLFVDGELHIHSLQDGSMLNRQLLAAAGPTATPTRPVNATPTPNPTLSAPSQEVAFYVFSPDGSRLAGITTNNQVQLWDTTTGKSLRFTRMTLSHPSERLQAAIFNADAGRLLLATQAGAIYYIETSNGRISYLRGALFDPRPQSRKTDKCLLSGVNGALLAVLCEFESNGEIKTNAYLADPTGKNTRLAFLDFPLPDTVFSLTADGNNLLFGSTAGTNGKILPPFKATYSNGLVRHSGALPGCSGRLVRFDPRRSTQGLLAGDGGYLQRCDLSNGKSMVQTDEKAPAIGSLAIGRSITRYRIASGSCSGEIILRRLDTGVIERTLAAHSGCVNDLSFSAKGSRLASAGADGLVQVWDLSRSSSLPLLKFELGESALGVSLSPDGALVAAVSNTLLNVRQVSGGKLLFESKISGGHGGVAFSPDGRLLAANNWDAQGNPNPVMWSNTQRARDPLLGTLQFASATFDPAGTLLAMSGSESLWLWATSGDHLNWKVENNSPIAAYGAAFTPDGCLLIYTDSTGITLLDTQTRLAASQLHPWGVAAVHDTSLSPDGRLLALALQDGGVQVFGLPGADQSSPGNGVPKASCSPIHPPTATSTAAPTSSSRP